MRHIALEKYYKRHFVNILTSQFIYKKSKKVEQLLNVTSQVFVQGTSSTYFLYLFLLTKKIASFKEYSNNTKFEHTRNKYGKQQKILISYVNFSHQAIWKFLVLILYPTIRSQPISEWAVFKFVPAKVILTLWDLPLGYQMTKLLSEQQYIQQFPLRISFYLEGLSLFNKLFILKALKFVNLPHRFNGLN